MNAPKQSWEALERTPRGKPESSDTADEMVMRAVIGGAGKDMLDWLHREIVEKDSHPTATDAQLRWDAAQRALVQRLEAMRDRGVEIAARRNKP